MAKFTWRAGNLVVVYVWKEGGGATIFQNDLTVYNILQGRANFSSQQSPYTVKEKAKTSKTSFRSVNLVHGHKNLIFHYSQTLRRI